MTLSQFLRDYLYIPLGGNRHGETRRLINLMLTMLLGGLWHGANWTFVVWGALHGGYLCVNHMFQKFATKFQISGILPKIVTGPLSVMLTFVLVVVAWVFFRAEDVHSALAIVEAMSGLQEQSLVAWESVFASLSVISFIGYFVVSMGIVWLMPNAYELMDLLETKVKVSDVEGHRITSMVCVAAGVLSVTVLGVSLLSTFGNNVISPFLYFQF